MRYVHSYKKYGAEIHVYYTESDGMYTLYKENIGIYNVIAKFKYIDHLSVMMNALKYKIFIMESGII